jgi:hypothetical protein
LHALEPAALVTGSFASLSKSIATRVLRRGYDVSRHGEPLIAPGERPSAPIAMATAMTKPQSLLEQRIWNKVRKKQNTPMRRLRRLPVAGRRCPKSGQQLPGALLKRSAHLHDQRPGPEFNHDPTPAIEEITRPSW